jgi:hypothetical protein
MDRNLDKDVVDVMCDRVHMLEPIRAEDLDEPLTGCSISGGAPPATRDK